jgi:hypothetical protein
VACQNIVRSLFPLFRSKRKPFFDSHLCDSFLLNKKKKKKKKDSTLLNKKKKKKKQFFAKQQKEERHYIINDSGLQN